MAEIQKCSRCKCNKTLDLFKIRANTGQILKTCIQCSERFGCHLCEYKSTSNININKHIKQVHDKIKDTKCPECEYTCSTNGALRIHTKQVHDKIKDMKCPKCKYTCSTKGDLNKHIKAIHDKIKDLHCPKCDFTCSAPPNIKQHIKICTGKLNVSAGEYAVMKCLELLGIEYEREVSPITGHRKMRYDFCVIFNGETVYIEYDGRQHYEPVRFGGISMDKAVEALVKCKKHDKIKNDYCVAQTEKLIRIPYWDFDNIPQILQGHFTTE